MEPDLDQARRRAKELLRAARARDPQALARLRDDREPRLADAQRAVAAELGFPSWPAFVQRVQATRGHREERRARLVEAALDNRADVAERLLAHDPSLASAGLDVALVLGDDVAVARALRQDPGLVTRGHPLAVACGSAFLKTPRAAGVLRVVRLLLERGADPDDGQALFRSLFADDTACAELLLAHGATVRGTGALAFAIADHSVAKVRMLLERGDLRPEDPELRDALLFAGNPEMVRLLIDHGADLEARDAHGRTPYMRAARFRDPATRDLLAAAGADTALDPAGAYVGAIVRGELDRAAEIRARHPDLELTPDDEEDLPRWASAGETEIVARLLDAGVRIDAPGREGGTALHYAAHWGRVSTVALLLDRGADVHRLAGDVPGNALAWTAWGSSHLPGSRDRPADYLAVAELLLAAGSEVTEEMVRAASPELAAVLAGAR
jgi:ankyrin repeat protein